MALAAPWDGASAENQQFVLVTGANSGIGLGIAKRLIDEFLAQRPAAAHLVLVVTTRSASKTSATLDALRAHLRRLRPSAAAADGADGSARIHLAGVELDLCRLPSVHAAAARLGRGIHVYSGRAATPVTAALPRLDAVLCNAGIGGWTGLDWGALASDVLLGGLLMAMTYPTCKLAPAGRRVDPLTGAVYGSADEAAAHSKALADPDSTLGEVFCANVFGHYVLAHALLPLLRRRPAASSPLPPARIVWESSVEAVCWDYLRADDLQGLRTAAAYESSKRLTDVLALTSSLPGVRSAVAPFLRPDGDSGSDDAAAASPQIYVTHPGVVCSTIFPLPWILVYFYNLAMYLARWAGSPWHPVTAYKGAAAAVWVALQPADALAAAVDTAAGHDATRVKWGASTTRSGRSVIKQTEVEGWGWDGNVERAADDQRAYEHAIQRRTYGRRYPTTDLTPERRLAFEALGRTCWEEMERLRVLWADRVAAAGAEATGRV